MATARAGRYRRAPEYPGRQETSMPTLDHAHALVVGIAGYQHVEKLPAVRDAQDIAALLRDPAHCGYPAANVRLLLDGQATRAALRHNLAVLAQRATAESTG